MSALGAIQYAVTELIQTAANPETADRMRRIAAAPYEQVLEERVVFGTPGEIVDTFKGYQEDFGVTGVVMEVNYGGPDPGRPGHQLATADERRGDAALQRVSNKLSFVLIN